MIKEEQIGGRIKKLRMERNLTQHDLADASGMTKSYLSKIENSNSAPPVSTLINLAKALGVDLDAIFNKQEPETIYCIVRRDERLHMPRKGSSFGYTYQPLAQKYPNRHMEPYCVTLPVSEKMSDVFQHPGEELLIIVSGALEFFLEDTHVTLESGDSIYFDSGHPHHFRVKGNEPVKCTLVIYSPPKEES